jgi:sulfur carrier protein ThiS
MNVTVRFYAELARSVNGGRRQGTFEVPEGSTVDDLLGTLGVPFRNGLIVGRNGELANRAAVLADGDELELMTVMEGGSPVVSGQWSVVSSDHPLTTDH